jgi:hypothetical protein
VVVLGLKCVILTGIPASIFPGGSWTLHVRTLDFIEFVEVLRWQCDSIENYNRHEPTNKLLDKYGIKYTRGTEYRLQLGDHIYVLGLKKRAPVGDVPVTEDDLVVLHIIARPVWKHEELERRSLQL